MATIALVVGLAASASAEVTCARDEFGQVVVFLNDPGDSVVLRISGVDLTWNDGSGFEQCGDATRNNVDQITVEDRSDGNTHLTIDLRGGSFGPGAENEAGDTDEIEWSIDLGGGRRDELSVIGTIDADGLLFGSSGMNLNDLAEDSGTRDNDAPVFDGVNELFLIGEGEEDRLWALGGGSMGSPFAGEVRSDGGAADDNMVGGTGDDHLGGGPGDDFLNGLGGEDTLIALAGDDTLNGGAQDDLLNGGLGNDIVAGQTGRDTASYQLAAERGVVVRLSVEERQDTEGAGRDRLDGIENLIGSGYSDYLEGDGGRNRLVAGGDARVRPATPHGLDELVGLGGADVLVGGAPNEIFTGSGGDDTINAGGSGDNARGSSGDDTIRGGGGGDFLFGGSGADEIFGQRGNDDIDGGSNVFDRCIGGSGNDDLRRCEILV